MYLEEYMEDVLIDAKEFIDDNIQHYDNWYDMSFHMAVCITGADNESYYCSSYKAREAVKDVVWDDRVSHVIILEEGPEMADVRVRDACITMQLGIIKEYFEEKLEEYLEEEDADEV